MPANDRNPLMPQARNWYSPESLERCSTPGRTISDYEPTPDSPLFEPMFPARQGAADGAEQDLAEGQEQTSGIFADMDYEESKPQLEQTPAFQGHGAAQQASELHGRESSDEDDIPLRSRRSKQNPRKPHSENTAIPRARPVLHEPVVTSNTRAHKKPGPKPWAAKPVMKNDMKAKMETIRSIESLWGKNFIKAYIPKCHRPLVKKRKNGKRTVYRDHETDPTKWLPSVLKAVLMIAQLTDDKLWLKKTMAEVVRYRIKHTGNRKPQLVTTDFDVIEDMLTREWSCEQSFGIRYKHLLMSQPKDERPADEDIDHILGIGGSGSEDDSDDDENLSGLKKESDDDEDMEMDEDEEDFVPASNFMLGEPHASPRRLTSSQPPKRSKSSFKRPQPIHQSPDPHQPQPPMYGYGGYGPYPGYGPPMNGYGHPMPGFPPHTKGFPPPMYGYGPYGGYGQQGPSKDPRATQQDLSGMPPPFWPQPPMTPTPSATGSQGGFNPGKPRFSPFGASKRGSRAPSHPEAADDATYGMDYGYKPPHMQSNPYTENPEPHIKREAGEEERPIAIDDFEAPSNFLGSAQSEEPGEEIDDAAENAMRLELEEAEAQHKLIQLRKRLAMAQAKKNRGASGN